MCLLMVCLPGMHPERKLLENACSNNSDGYSFAVHHGDHITTARSMKSDRLLDRFYDELDKSPTAFGTFHARISTHGATTLDNNHSFRVGGRSDLVLSHNGMLPIPDKGDGRSDTRIFAEDVLPALGVTSLDDPYAWNALEDWANGSKIAILSTAPELRDQLYIVNESLGHWKDNIWWSNSSYEYLWGSAFGTTGYYGGAGRYSSSTVIDKNDDDYDAFAAGIQCFVCLSTFTEDDYDDGLCTTCNSCLDCFENAFHCLCYKPAAKVSSSQELINYPYSVEYQNKEKQL